MQRLLPLRDSWQVTNPVTYGGIQACGDRTQVMITPYLISGPGQLEMSRERTLLPVKLALEPWEGGSTTLQGTL